MGAAVEKAAKAMAKAAQDEGHAKGGKTGGRGRANSSGRSSPKAIRDEGKRADAQEAAAAGMKRDTYRKAKEVVRSGDKEIIGLMDRTGKVER